VYNAADEECVTAFLEERLPFAAIVDTVAQVVAEHVGSGRAGNVGSVEDVLAAETWARRRAREITQPQKASE
jgi:1-deoxy-D-xylulose-5-phosphate reductoisomerase